MVLYNAKKLKILQAGAPALRQVSDEVKEYDKTLGEFAKTLTKLMKDPLNDGVETVGISAVQVGVLIRLCICQNPNSGKNIPMVNPEIIEASADMSKALEGCISVGTGPNQLFGYVPRPSSVKVRYFDLKGQENVLNAKGLFSHIVQHEIDHMNGVLFIDYFKDPGEIMTLAELNEHLKKKDAHLNAI